MKGTHDRMREVEEMIDAAGLKIERVKPGSHFKFYVRNQHGVASVFVAGSSPSGGRTSRNMRTTLRRIATRQE